MPGDKVFRPARLRSLRRGRYRCDLAALALSACFIVLPLASAHGRGAQSQDAQKQSQIGYHTAPDADQRKTVLLQDFHPSSMLGWPENLGWVSEILNRYSNVMVEFGGREAELGCQPRAARELFIKYQDRVMFGSDNGMETAMYRNYFRWLETADESFDYWGSPSQGRWEIYGLHLPDAGLEKIYHRNAEKLFAQFRGMHVMKEGR